MTKLAELASLIRSKNAGAFQLTIDVMFDDPVVYERVKASGSLTKAKVAGLYGLDQKDVLFFFCDNALAVKASIPRPAVQGDLGDSDNHAGQQYAPLMDVEI